MLARYHPQGYDELEMAASEGGDAPAPYGIASTSGDANALHEDGSTSGSADEHGQNGSASGGARAEQRDGSTSGSANITAQNGSTSGSAVEHGQNGSASGSANSRTQVAAAAARGPKPFWNKLAMLFKLFCPARSLKVAIGLGLVLDFALLFTNSYLLTNIDTYTPSKKTYLLKAWIGIFLPTSAFLALLMLFLVKKYQDLERESPVNEVGKSAKEKKKWTKVSVRRHSKMIQRLVALVIEFLIFLLISLYFWRSALDQYNSFKWEIDASSNPTGVQPAVAILGYGSGGDAASANSTGVTKCYFPYYEKENSTNCSLAFRSATGKNSVQLITKTYGELWWLHYNSLGVNYTPPSKKPIPPFNSLSDQLELQTWVKWNSSNIHYYYNTTAPQNPYMFVAVYDNRVTLETAIGCGIVALTELPALGSTTLTLTSRGVQDPFNLLNYSKTCSPIVRKDPPYTQFQFDIASTGTSFGNECDIASAVGQASVGCISQIILRYSSFTVSTDRSVRKTDHLTIWLNEGAIVGAVLILGYFVTVFSI